ncbi:S10 family peptidase [Gallaecimonas mangrovi]|uniref:S10 family peptidase n=1 Tax=Gallaecimonas mangrovi TaxID=2291597 RepID=UPI001D034E2E|nr:peptidase S10 [Gallaecimonas mangrovi]
MRFSSVLLTTACLLSPLASAMAQANTVKDTTVEHSGSFAGQSIHYRSVVEHFNVTPAGLGEVNLVSTSYIKDGNHSQRPVLFAFNGGPISPSIYIQLLALGPKRMAVPNDLSADPATFKLVDNHQSPLDKADLVFYDPAGTGFSHFAKGTEPTQYFGNVNDGKEFVAFAHAWLKRHHREGSPVFILGESYGTMRTAEAVKLLSAEKKPINLKGIFLLGQALNLTETSQRPENIVTYSVSLPTLAALGWYHGKVDKTGRTFAQLLDQTRAFAAGPYLTALYQGTDLPKAQEKAIAYKLQNLTGLSAKVFIDHDLRVSKNLYRAELLKDQGLVLGASDGRYATKPAKPGDLPDGVSAIYPALENRYHQYAEQFLKLKDMPKYNTDSPIHSLNSWDWGSKAGPFGNWAYDQDVRQAMEKLPQLQVAVGAGYYDTLTTTGATEYLMRQAHWPKDRASLHYYQGGHMCYTVKTTLDKFSGDLRHFIQTSK